MKISIFSIGLFILFISFQAAAAPAWEASYPFLEDLKEATGKYGDAVLEGNPTPPDPPEAGAPLCQNGIYILSGIPDGQNVRTDLISGLDITDFQVSIEFRVASIDYKRPVIVGTPNRFIGFQISPEGYLGALYNLNKEVWSDTKVKVDRWYAAEIRFENGALQILLDGELIHHAVIGDLTLSGGHTLVKDFETNNRTNGTAFHGCIRNLNLYNDTDLFGVEAWYPLETNLEDKMGNYADITLLGEVSPPAVPTVGSPLCLNGVYIQSFTNGQDINTAFIDNLDDGKFQFNVDFRPASIGSRYPVLVGGFASQWIGIIVDDDGTLGIKWNNVNYSWSETQVEADNWYTAQLKFVNGVVHLFLGDERIHEEITGSLNAPPFAQFSANDGAVSQAFHGCLKNIVFLDETSISYEDQLFCDGFESGDCVLTD